MGEKTIKWTYWIITILFSLFFLMDGIMALMRSKAGVDAMTQLGYPLYVMTILGIAKLAGIIFLVQNEFPILREWAYAGFTFNFVGAAMSWYFAKGPVFFIVLPLIFLAVMMFSYYLWKKIEVAK